MEAQSNTIDEWFGIIRGGKITLPRFQRPEAWTQDQIKAVLENILREPSLPIGALLTLEVGDKEMFPSRSLVGAQEPQGRPDMQLLDGQQRMTAIWRSLTDNYEEFTVFVSLDNSEQPRVEIVNRHVDKNLNRIPAWADSPAACFERNLIPAKVLAPGTEGEQAKEAWIQDACHKDAARELSDRIWKLRKRVWQYSIPFLSLPLSTDAETAIDVFVGMNMSAMQLKDFDIVVAQVEGSKGESLVEMIDDLKERIPAIEEYGKVEDAVLAVGAMLAGKVPGKRTYHELDFGEELLKQWPKILLGMERATKSLHEEMIFNEKLMPSEVILHLISALWAEIPVNANKKIKNVSPLIRKTIWRASFTDRYLTPPRAIVDHKAIQGLLLSDPQIAGQPPLFDNDLHRLPGVGRLVHGGWPAKKDRLGRAILSASLFGGGQDLSSGKNADAINTLHREYRHIFPQELIPEDENIPPQWTESALNCWFVSGKERLRAKSPGQYLEHLAEEAGINESELRSRLESHMIPYDELAEGKFREFLEARAEKIFDIMQKLVTGEQP